MLKMKNKKGEMLVENVIFIILNLVFISILVLFLFNQTSNGAFLEETYSKKIALMVDASQPEMIIKLDMEKAKKVSEKNGIDFEDVVRKEGNKISVQLTENSIHSYYFFNDVNLEVFPETDDENEYTGLYILTIGGKNE
jgi:uncharacterized protein (UPF0333 family)